MFAECGSPAFDEFLELMGDKVRMKGFSKYRAQLDNKSECPSDPRPSPHFWAMLTWPTLTGSLVSSNLHWATQLLAR